jgi:hypothetical protein
MLTRDETQGFWHPGTKLGIIYALLSLVVLGLTRDPAPAVAWLEQFSIVLVLLPLAAASHAYVAGKRAAVTPNEVDAR